MLRRLVLCGALAVSLTGCQGSMIRSFEKVEPGMDKHQVLERVGSPTATTRLHGKDRWIYRFYEDDVVHNKEVHFTGGAVSYIGEAWKPAPEKTAEARDAANAESNRALKAEDDEREALRKSNAEAYRAYELKARNNDKVKYMPDFVDLK